MKGEYILLFFIFMIFLCCTKDNYENYENFYESNKVVPDKPDDKK